MTSSGMEVMGLSAGFDPLGWLCAVLGHVGAVCVSGFQWLLPLGPEMTLLANLPLGES